MSLCIVAGAGPGMGASIAHRFAREGFDVAVLARSEAHTSAIVSEIAAHGTRVGGFNADLCEPDTVVAAFRDIEQSLGSADVLVYNGARWHEQPVMSLDPMTFNWDVALCATGALLCSQLVYPGMKARGGGTLIFTGGGLALYPERGAGVASLSAGKAALRALVYAMATELAPDNIHACTVTIAGAVTKATALDPNLIADLYVDLHSERRDAWSVERIVSTGGPMPPIASPALSMN